MMTTRLVLVALVIGVAAADARAQDLTISNVRILVGNGQVIEQGAVVVRSGRIASVGVAAAAAAGTRTIDGRGLTATPGFIDAHRHIINGNSDQWFKEQAVVRMQEFLDAGYTTLMSGGGPVPGIVQLKERIDKGQLKGPRIVTSGRADPDNFKTAEEARAQVRMLKQAGVEIIKARIEPPAADQQLAILRAVTDEAKKQNLGVMVHAVSPRAMVEAVKAGATKLVHTPHNGSRCSRRSASACRCSGSSTRTTSRPSATANHGLQGWRESAATDAKRGRRRSMPGCYGMRV
jgi:imidazolonepropionase-like amidohydrolase